MSLAVDSLSHSSSIDDFIAILNTELESTSSQGSPLQENNDAEDIDIDYLEKERFKRCKVDVDASKGSTLLGAVEEEIDASEASTNVQICPHRLGSFYGMCNVCGRQKDDEIGVAFGYIYKGLKLDLEEIARLRALDLKHVLHHRKLRLILDLDHTLLNSTHIVDILPQEEYLKNRAGPSNGDCCRSLFKLEDMQMLTKIRPFVHSFLKEASSMFELYIYTKGNQYYAWQMANLLDPEKKFFSSRVISQADCTQTDKKGLDVVPVAESAVVILDDTEFVWEMHKENLILMERYNFFASSLRQFGFSGQSLSMLKRDESDTYGALASVLKVLRRTHQMYFDPDLGIDIAQRDVRQILNVIRNDILNGCKIVFSGIFPIGLQAKNHQLWKMAEQLGGACSTELDQSVTHVVSMDTGTEKARWAVQQKKFLVHPRWIEAAKYLWQRPCEDQFLITKVVKSKGALKAQSLIGA